jgi:hypothetical protein
LLEVVRVEKRDEYMVVLSCTFAQSPSEVSARIRAKVASYLAASRR